MQRARRNVSTVVAVVGALTAAGPARAGEIESVVVFADRARVTRVRAARCEQGKALVTFEGLPATLDARALRGDARDGAEVIGVATELVNGAEAADPRARALLAEQKKIAADLRAEEARQETVDLELKKIDAYAGIFDSTLGEEIRNPRPNPAHWTRTLEALRARRATLAEHRRRSDITLRGLRLEQDKVARQLAHFRGEQAPRSARRVTVTLACRKEGAGYLVRGLVSYVVPGATWQPEYDIDFTPKNRQAKAGPGLARLTVGALVRQATGEDWDGVQLLLSTARPKLGVEAPQPAPLVIDGHKRPQEKVMVQAQERRERLAGGGTAGGGGATAAVVDDKGNAFVLTLPHRITVPSDGRPLWAPVDVVETQATAKLVTTPKLDEHVYQVVVLKNPAAYALLEGRVRSYRAGSYVGESQLRYRGQGEPFELSLGIDDALRVERIATNSTKGPGFLGSTKELRRTFRITLKNGATTPETVELREGIPVSKTADIKIALAGAPGTTPGYQHDQERGFLTWPVTLKSGEERAIDLAYAIRLPDSWSVAGRE